MRGEICVAHCAVEGDEQTKRLTTKHVLLLSESSTEQNHLFSGSNRVKFQCSELLVHEKESLVNGPPVKETRFPLMEDCACLHSVGITSE